jgi:tetratricopeptide (TPR) repeat protein
LDRLSAAEQSRLGAGEDRVYENPYESCEPLPQKVDHGEEPRYLAEVWWQIGNFHFDQMDAGAGPYAFNRAATAYEESLRYKKPPLYGVALYKRAWTYYKQQRYREAVAGFVELLRYADEQEEKTGDPGADFRNEAYTYIAGSLTYTDFDGPPANHPFIPRSDVFDEESDPLVAEERLRVAIDRLQDPALIPQDQEWTVDIYRALAQEFIEITQLRNAILTLELTLRKFPLSRDAPFIQARVADLYDEVAQLAPEGSAVRAEAKAKALQARTQLADYVGDSPWVRANQDEPEALYRAERLVRQGLQRAAAAHTNAARSNAAKAERISDPIAKSALLEQAIVEYRSAAKGWAGYIDQDPNALDAYESQFWRADALFGVVTLQLELGRSPTDEEVHAAREAARRVRDSNEDDKFQQPAAYYVVVLADRLLDKRYQEHAQSGGARGIAKLEEVQMLEDGDQAEPATLPMPPEVVAAADARDEYNQAISYEDDPEKNGLLYAFQAADYYFVYGHFDVAKERFSQIYEAHCGRNEWGYKAWEKLLSMSNLQSDADQSRKLVDGKSCAFDEQTRAAEEAIRTPVRQGVAYLDARSLYDAAEKMAPGEERNAKWREAAAAYKVALDAAPDRDEAPEAAMNGAFAYKQVGDYDKAIEMYELFVSRYGKDEKLLALRDGNSQADPPQPPQPDKYETRTKYLKMAYDALANAYVLFFDYPKAASTFDAIGRNSHFAAPERQLATEQALKLYASLGDDNAMVRARDQLANQGAAGVDLAQADFIIATSALKEWDQFSPDSGANASARQRAEDAMKSYYAKHRDNADSQAYVVEAGYWMAKMRRAAKGRDEAKWWENTMLAFSRLRGNSPTNERGVNAALGTPQASMAAEGAYILLDDELRKRFDYDSGHHQFRGTPQQVLAQFNQAATEAKGYFERLQSVVDEYGSPEWGTAAIARQGSLYDSLRTGLYNTRPPELEMFDAKTERLLQQAEESDNLELQEKADAIRIKVETAWNDQRDRELASADQIAVDRYGAAIVLARRYNLSTPAVVRAISRLAFLTSAIGEDKLANYASRVQGLQYARGMFLRLRPGMVEAPEPNLLPAPAPAKGGSP